MSYRTLIVALAALAVLAIAGCSPQVVTVPTEGETVALNTVATRGSADVSIAPDQAEMSFAVETEGREADATLSEASQKAQSIVDAVKDAGVDDEDIQTTDISVWPQYDYDGDTPRIDGYRATIRVSVTITEIEDVGEVIQSATDAGANSMHGPTFTLSEDSPQRTEALGKAVDDARARAEAMAEAAGRQVGDVLSLSEEGVQAPPIEYTRSASMADEAGGFAPPVEPGQIDVYAGVTVVFELK